MAGKIQSMIARIIEQRSGGTTYGASAVRVRLLLRGIDPDLYNATSDDDPAVIAKLQQMAAEFNAGSSNSTGGVQ